MIPFSKMQIILLDCNSKTNTWESHNIVFCDIITISKNNVSIFNQSLRGKDSWQCFI